MSSDSELLRRFIDDHSQEAFTALVQRYLNLVYFAALRRTNGDSHVAEDITQQVFAELGRRASKLQHQPVLTGWLYVATKHTALNVLRREKRRIAREQEAHAMQEIQNASDSNADWNQLRPQLDDALDDLNEKDRVAVLLRYFENRPFAKIGAALSVSEDAARVRVERALDKLRSLLVHRGITSTAAALAVALGSQSALAAPATLATSVTGYALSSSAVAATKTTLALKLLQAMSTTKTLVATTSAIAILAVGATIYEAQEFRRSQASLSSTTQEIAALREREQSAAKRLTELEKNLHAAERLAASLQKSTSEALAPKKPVTATNIAATLTPDQLATHPNYVELSLKHHRSALPFEYRRLYRQLGLTPQQITDFESALMEWDESLLDTAASVQAQGLSGTDLTALTSAAKNRLQEKLRNALGDAGYEQYKNYRKTGAAAYAVKEFSPALFYNETPLTPMQADQLTQLVAENTGKSTSIQTPDGGTRTYYGAIHWAAVTAQAKNVLSPVQLQVLAAWGEKESYQKQVTELTRKLNEEARDTQSNNSKN